ncbi:hypothetical protein [Halogranum rubrum]|uniref:Uncharacterized protein n=1 Tax=Halogranum salarium B-1 TaxID=1210908 RepID=J3JDI9_9EURY|nr:hypothetical protein [Halogranum salarium]EJN57529.1 hypothetical protein HSB1_42170 [Halogranum salarium B-1]
MTDTGASPAAVFSGTQGESMGEFVVGEPHVSRLTPTLAGRVEVEGWVTSSPVMAQDYNAARSNKPSRSSDGDDDGDGVDDGTEEAEAVLAYLGGEAMVAERFTVCLPDAEVPGGNGSIREEVTPERLIAYLTDGDGGALLSKSDSKSRTVEGGGDCDDDDADIYPGASCGTTPHFVSDVTGPVATGGVLEVIRAEDGSVLVVSSPPGTDGGSERVCATTGDDPCGPGVWARTTESGSSTGVSAYRAMVQPPGCPEPFPAVLYVQRCESDDQLVYTGGWVIDDAALYENSVTVLSMTGPTDVVPVGSGDLDGDGLGDLVKRSGSGARAGRGARLDWGTLEELVEVRVLSESGGNGIRKRPQRKKYDIELLHVSGDAPVVHLTSASRASQDVKFKAGAELSGQVN